MNAILMQNGKSAFTDANGRPLVSGTVTFYQPGTNTLKDTWRDTSKTVLNTNPVILDARGEASIYGDGAYRQVLRDFSGNLIWDQIVPDLIEPITSAVNAFYLTSSVNVDNIAALKSLSKIIYKNAQTRGYYSSGDGGAGRYYLDAFDVVTADNGGTVIVANDGGRWKLIFDLGISLYQWGAKGDGSTDDTLAVQKAINWASTNTACLHVPSCVGFKLTAPILVSGSPRIIGEQVQISKTVAQNLNTQGVGSWFYLAHTGIGFKFNDLGTVVKRPWTELIGTYRDQPVPGTADYVPASNDWDFYFYNCDSVVRNIVTWNATKGIFITADPDTSQSRCDISGYYGCPYSRGITVEFCADVVRIDNIHFWPYTSSNVKLAEYIRNNAIGITLFRCDNPMITRYFTYGYRLSLFVGTNSFGTAGKVKLSTFDFDAFGRSGILIDSQGASGMVSQGVGQGQNSVTTENFFEISPASSGCNFAIDNIDVGLTGKNVIRLGGTLNNVLRIGANVRLFQWNGINGNWPAIDCTENNFIEIASMPYFTAAYYDGPKLAISGNIKAEVELPIKLYNTGTDGRFSIAPGFGRPPSSIVASVKSDTTPIHVQQTSTDNVLLASYVSNGAPYLNMPITASAHITFE